MMDYFDKVVADLEAKVREAFKAGFLAHPDPEAETFTWSFDPAGFNIAADREASAWEAWEATQR